LISFSVLNPMEMRLQLVLVHDTSPMTGRKKPQISKLPDTGKTVPLLGLHRSFCIRIFCKKKICFYGPESTGKTTMATKLASIYQTDLYRKYPAKLLPRTISRLKTSSRLGMSNTAGNDKQKISRKLLFCDSDLITTQIYSRHYLHVVPPVLFVGKKCDIRSILFFWYRCSLGNWRNPWSGERRRRCSTFPKRTGKEKESRFKW